MHPSPVNVISLVVARLKQDFIEQFPNISYIFKRDLAKAVASIVRRLAFCDCVADYLNVTCVLHVDWTDRVNNQYC